MRSLLELQRNRVLPGPRWLLAGCAALALIYFFWRTVIPAPQFNTHAFSAYYTSARLTLQGQAGVRFCDPWFLDRQRELGLNADFFCPSPPTMALLMLPVAWMPPVPARFAWIGLDLAMVAGIGTIAWWIVAGRGEQQRPRWPPDRLFVSLSLIATTFYQPLRADLRAIQVYTLIALLYALWLYGYRTRRDWLCGAAMAALALAKLSGWPLWVFAAVTGRWRTLAWAIALGTAGMLATLPLLSFDFWRLYLQQQLITIAPDPMNGSPAFQTLTSLLRQCFVYDARWSPAPLVDAPWLATLLWWLLMVLLLGATLRRAAADPTLLSAMTLYCLVVPLQPAGEQYHYTMLLIVVLVLLGGWVYRQIEIGSSQPLITAGLGSAGLLLIAPSYFLSPAWAHGGWALALLAYPRLYGALLLWGTLLLMRKIALQENRELGTENRKT